MVVHNTDFLGDIARDWAEVSTIGMVVSIRQEGDKPAETSFKAGIKRNQKKRIVAAATFRKSLQGKGLRNLALQA